MPRSLTISRPAFTDSFIEQAERLDGPLVLVQRRGLLERRLVALGLALICSSASARFGVPVGAGRAGSPSSSSASTRCTRLRCRSQVRQIARQQAAFCSLIMLQHVHLNLLKPAASRADVRDDVGLLAHAG